MTNDEFFSSLALLKQAGWTAYLDMEEKIRLKPPGGGRGCCPVTAVNVYVNGRDWRVGEVDKAAKKLRLDPTFWSYVVHAADKLQIGETKPDRAIRKMRPIILRVLGLSAADSKPYRTAA